MATIMDIYKGKNKAAVEEFIDFSYHQLADMNALEGADLGKLQRNAIFALIVIDVHTKKVIAQVLYRQQ